ncbi:alpha-galactosidase [Acidaminobacter sp. JC074]|uniref:alpha-galactosidase n=1 Tax=Acidaminobacter sp. JC074 TaxID=2530199 RepID=UPI001F0D9374|nr:alpha-galactosidase [Acidaminobacter sp. JC074]MCH4889655.1 alpha-galactosidase [Acidaminobacter sp. JC074]
MIKYKDRVFNLQTDKTSYIMRIAESGHLEHIHYGGKVTDEDFTMVNPIIKRPWSGNPLNDGSYFSLDNFRSECPTYGHTDFSEPMIDLLLDDRRVFDFRYISHQIGDKHILKTLPSATSGPFVETLELTLKDTLYDIYVKLYYSVYESLDVVVRSLEIINQTDKKLTINKALSASIDFADSDFDMLQLSGAWARERHLIKRDIRSGTSMVDSKRGNSSHQQNPAVAIIRKDCHEDYGQAYGMSLIYSGNFSCVTDVNDYNRLRVGFGINPFHFLWDLKPGESFETPELVMTYSSQGLNKMSQNFHAFIKDHILRGLHQYKERPILLNNWEATYFDFTEKKLLELADKASQVGAEMFVLDDGWFGKRNSPDSSLGDWYVNKDKIPSGLEGLSKKINEKGLKFGLWVEPEMISQKSDLYKNHPDWCLHEVGRSRSETRNQLVLDYTRQDVRDYIVKSLIEVFKNGNIEYVKWDMNRNITEPGSKHYASGEIFHRYILGLYDVLKRITEACPDILFEACAGGGGRFDMGILAYMPQVWTSDDTDAHERVKIQDGTSLFYPPITMGAHVSAVPNHQVDRMTSLETRYHIAASCNLGYELDLTSLTVKELDEIKLQIEDYKSIRKTVQFGKFYRLKSPFNSNETAWQVVNEDQVLVYYYRALSVPNAPMTYLRLKDLEDGKYEYQGRVYTSDYLMNIGIGLMPEKGDFKTRLLRFKKTS